MKRKIVGLIAITVVVLVVGLKSFQNNVNVSVVLSNAEALTEEKLVSE